MLWKEEEEDSRYQEDCVLEKLAAAITSQQKQANKDAEEE